LSLKNVDILSRRRAAPPITTPILGTLECGVMPEDVVGAVDGHPLCIRSNLCRAADEMKIARQ
jgi:hypothetical protein